MAMTKSETAYKISIVAAGSKDSIIMPKSRTRKAVRKVSRRAVTVVLAIMIAFLGIFASIGAATPAHANPVEDGFKNAICTYGFGFYDLETKTALFSPSTGDENTDDATPYEKYGNAGLQFTVWQGPYRQEGLDKDGELGGKQIVNFVGGKGKSVIDQIGDSGPAGDGSAGKGEANQTYQGFYNSSQTCVPVMKIGMTAIANAIFYITTITVWFAGFVYQTAYEANALLLTTADGPLTLITNALKDAFYLEFLTPVVMLGALWMAWVGLVKKKSIEAAQGAVWMIASAVAGVALLTQPMVIPNTVNTVVSSASSAVISAVSNIGAKDDNSLCRVEIPTFGEGGGGKGASLGNDKPQPEVLNGAQTRANVRSFQCALWQNFLYTPWVMGEFGVNPNSPGAESVTKNGWADAVNGGAINGQPQLAPVENVAFNLQGTSQAPAGGQSWPLYHLDNKVKFKTTSSTEMIDQQRNLINVAVAQLHTAEGYNDTYKGEGSMNRIGLAIMAFLAASGAGIFVVVVGAGIILLQLSLILLMMMAPVILLAGVHPGFGRRIAMDWLQQIFGIAVKQIVLSAFLGIIISFYSVIFTINASGDVSWLLSMFLIVLASIGGFTFKKQLLNIFTKFLPGNSVAPSDGKVPGVVKNVVGGAVAGGTAAAFGGLLGRSKAGMKSAVAEVSQKAGSTVGVGGGAGKRVNNKKTPSTSSTSTNTRTAGAGAGAHPNRQYPTPAASTPKETKPGSTVDRAGRKANDVSEMDTSPAPYREPEKSSPVGERVEFPAEYVESNPAPRNTIDRRQVVKDLKEAGYRSHVGTKTIAKAALKGAVIGTVTGRPLAGIKAGATVVSKEKVMLGKRNAEAVEIAAEKARQQPRYQAASVSVRNRIVQERGSATQAPRKNTAKPSVSGSQGRPQRVIPAEKPRRGNGGLPPLPRPVPRPKE